MTLMFDVINVMADEKTHSAESWATSNLFEPATFILEENHFSLNNENKRENNKLEKHQIQVFSFEI